MHKILITIILFFKTKPRKAYYLSFQVVTTVLQTDALSVAPIGATM